MLSDQDSVRAAALNAMRFFADESCGQCTPCRAGTAQAARLMAAARWDTALLADLAVVMREASICGLGQAAQVGRWLHGDTPAAQLDLVRQHACEQANRQADGPDRLQALQPARDAGHARLPRIAAHEVQDSPGARRGGGVGRAVDFAPGRRRPQQRVEAIAHFGRQEGVNGRVKPVLVGAHRAANEAPDAVGRGRLEDQADLALGLGTQVLLVGLAVLTAIGASSLITILIEPAATLVSPVTSVA